MDSPDHETGDAKRHLLFLSHYFPPEGNAPASRTYEHCKRWVAEGHRVTVLTGAPNVPDGKVYEGYRNRIYQKEEIDGIRVIRVWTFIAPNKGTIRRTINYLSYLLTATLAGLFVRKPDVVIATSPQFFCGWAGVLVSKLKRRPFVLEIRDIWPESIAAVGAFGNKTAIRLLATLERWMYRAADTIVCVGEGYRAKLAERGVAAEKLRVVTNGADLELFKPGAPDQTIMDRYGFSGQFTVAYVGTLGMACGLDVVIETAKKFAERGIDEVQFLLVGDGARREELAASVAQNGLGNVRVTGRLPKESIPPLLRSIDACLIHLRAAPLFETVLPSKMFEAFATAKPVILGVRGDAARVLEEAGAGICIAPEDSQALFEAVETLRARPELREKLGSAGRHCAETRFDRDRLADEMLHCIQSTIDAN